MTRCSRCSPRRRRNAARPPRRSLAPAASESADRERAEEQMLQRYLPAQLSDEEVAEIVAGALASGGFAA